MQTTPYSYMSNFQENVSGVKYLCLKFEGQARPCPLCLQIAGGGGGGGGGGLCMMYM